MKLSEPPRPSHLGAGACKYTRGRMVLVMDVRFLSLRQVASGVRSALVKVDGVWYRLKGCGNNGDGFTVRNENAKTGLWRNVRGEGFLSMP